MADTTALVPVFSGTLSSTTVQLCDARTLHAFMQVRRDFTTWIKGRIRKFGFVLNEDYLLSKSGAQVFTNSGENLGGRPATDYHLTLDMAKELAMVENNDQGRAVRRYFIECERKALAAAAPQQIPLATPNPKEHDAMRALIKATRKQFALVEKQFAAWELAHPVVQPQMRSLRGTIEQAQRKADGSWALYVLCGDVAMGVAVSQECAPRGGLQAGDKVRMEYAPGVNPLSGKFSRVCLVG